jgi:uncharacterized protein (TIRG00374 family)
MAMQQNGSPAPKDSWTTRLLEKPQWVSWLLVLGLGALVALFAFSDARELWRTTQRVHLTGLLLPVCFSLLSYAAMARSYQDIARAAGHPVPFWEMLKVTYVANTVNYLITTGGLSGFAVRMYFFLRLKVPSGRAVTISLVQTFVTNLVLLLFVLAGFFYLLKTHELQGLTLVASTVLTSVFTVATVIAVFLLIHRRIRRRTLFLLAEAAHYMLRHLAPRWNPRRVRIWRFQRNLDRGIQFLMDRKTHMLAPIFWIVVDWVATLYILHYAFFAVGYPVPFSFVVVGFAVGIVLSLVSFIPGGLGIMEGSMAAIFTGLGVPFEVAVVAVLIFRLAYYVVPLIISVFLFRSVLAAGVPSAVYLDETPSAR